ncbi:MAG: hypothetical protein ACE5JS_03735 [Nitrospinota bacterium]
MRLNAVKFGLAFGIIYGLFFFLYTLAAALFGAGAEFMKMVGNLYVGVAPTVPGAIVAAVWGFAIGFIFFALAAWIYNGFVGRS